MGSSTKFTKSCTQPLKTVVCNVISSVALWLFVKSEKTSVSPIVWETRITNSDVTESFKDVDFFQLRMV